MSVHATSTSMLVRTGAALRPAGAVSDGPRRLDVPVLPRRLAAAQIDALIAIARANADGVWPLGADLARARNKHATNDVDELRDGLRGDHDWLEVDVRLAGGVPVASHDADIRADALRLADWVRVGAASGRGLKLDFKQRAAIAPTLDLVAAEGVPDARLIINVRVLGEHGLSLDQLRRMRRRFPRAVINLSPDVRRYDGAAIDRAVDLARSLGGPVAFALDAARVDQAIIRAFRRGGQVAVWNDPRRSPVHDATAVTRRLRAWGVDGMIDLR